MIGRGGRGEVKRRRRMGLAISIAGERRNPYRWDYHHHHHPHINHHPLSFQQDVGYNGVAIAAAMGKIEVLSFLLSQSPDLSFVNSSPRYGSEKGNVKKDIFILNILLLLFFPSLPTSHFLFCNRPLCIYLRLITGGYQRRSKRRGWTSFFTRRLTLLLWMQRSLLPPHPLPFYHLFFLLFYRLPLTSIDDNNNNE